MIDGFKKASGCFIFFPYQTHFGRGRAVLLPHGLAASSRKWLGEPMDKLLNYRFDPAPVTSF
jgi:hypothetical protein